MNALPTHVDCESLKPKLVDSWFEATNNLHFALGMLFDALDHQIKRNQSDFAADAKEILIDIDQGHDL